MPTSSARVYGDFKDRHPDYMPELWKRYRAFYAGGRKLLEDEELMEAVFPKHFRESKEAYDERTKRAFYIPYAGEVLDSIVASLTYKPIMVEGHLADGEPDEETGKMPENDDPFYPEFFENCASPEAIPMSINQLARDQIQLALQLQTAWALVDLPSDDAPTPAEGVEPEQRTVAEADAKGLRSAYVVPLDPEAVINWEVDKAGRLDCVLVHSKESKWGGPGTHRDMITETFTYYTETTWERWTITYKESDPPKDEAEMTPAGGGEHSFGCVPVVRLTLPDGLHAMGKIESIAREHFNKRNAVSWSQLKNLLPILAAKVARSPMDPDGVEGTQNLLTQGYGPGKILILGEDDTLEYVAPDAAVYESAMADLSNLRDEMHRVLHAMAQSVDNSGAALQRAAASKQEDKESMNTILRALGGYVRDYLKEIYCLVQCGRADETPTEWCVSGMDEFTDQSVADLIEQAMTMETVTLPSQTFQVRYKLKIAKAILGKDYNEQIEDKIRTELEGSITAETFDTPTPRETFDAEQEAAKAKTAGKPAPPIGGK
jgi:hypothetical protein